LLGLLDHETARNALAWPAQSYRPLMLLSRVHACCTAAMTLLAA
jgi:hypothetical protein